MANRTQRQKAGPVIHGNAEVADAPATPAADLHRARLKDTLVPTVLIGPEGGIEGANRAFARLVGHDRKQVLRMWSSDLFLAVVEDGLAVPTLQENTGDVVELLHGDLWVVHAALSVEPVSMRFGPGLVASCTDRTERPDCTARVVPWPAP